jgi:hypothetical protein
MTHLSESAARLSDAIPTNSEGGISIARLSVCRHRWDGTETITELLARSQNTAKEKGEGHRHGASTECGL